MNKNKVVQIVALAIASTVLALALAACGSSGSSSSGTDASSAASAGGDDKTITVAASPTPHAQILNDAVAPLLEAEGYTLEVKEYTDYVLPNTATEEGEVDANFFQHVPYLDDFNAEQGTHLVNVAGVHIEPMRIYAGKASSLDAVSDGASVAVPNDATNEARALLLLQAAGLIKLSDPSDIAATPKDIVDNPLNLQFQEVEAANVPNVRADVDIAVINTNYALEADIPEDQILYTEAGDSPYVNVVVVREGNENTPGIQALVKAVTSSEVADYINKTYGGAVVAVN